MLQENGAKEFWWHLSMQSLERFQIQKVNFRIFIRFSISTKLEMLNN